MISSVRELRKMLGPRSNRWDAKAEIWVRTSLTHFDAIIDEAKNLEGRTSSVTVETMGVRDLLKAAFQRDPTLESWSRAELIALGSSMDTIEFTFGLWHPIVRVFCNKIAIDEEKLRRML
jgi:hypothetical protein